jgi:hypothetical protein
LRVAILHFSNRLLAYIIPEYIIISSMLMEKVYSPYSNAALLRFLLACVSLQLFVASVSTAQDDSCSKPHFLGHINASAECYSTSDTFERYKPFSWTTYGDIALKTRNWNIPLSFVLSEKERSERQAFNQIGMSAEYKNWLKLHAGYHNYYFSSFTLAGLTLLGGGLELNPGKLRFAGVYGRLLRRVPYDSSNRYGSLPTFERRPYALKLGYGTEKNFVDLIYLRAADEAGSLSGYERGGLTPAENHVGGLAMRLALSKQLVVDAEAALSVYTRNTEDSTVFDVPKEIPVNVNLSSQALSAVRASLTWAKDRWSVALLYKRIEPDYRSMGAYYFQNDVEQLMLAPKVSLVRRSLNISASVGGERNNLFAQHSFTNERIISNGNIDWQINSHHGLTLQFSDYGTSDKQRLPGATDSNRLAYVQSQYSLAHRFQTVKRNCSHGLFTMLMYGHFSSEGLTVSLQSEVLNAAINYNISFIKQTLTLTGGLTYAHTSIGSITTRTPGINIGFNKGLLKGQMQTGLSYSYQPTTYGNEEHGLFSQLFANCSYQADAHHSFYLQASHTYTRQLSALNALPPLNEWRVVLSYQYIIF